MNNNIPNVGDYAAILIHKDLVGQATKILLENKIYFVACPVEDEKNEVDNVPATTKKSKSDIDGTELDVENHYWGGSSTVISDAEYCFKSKELAISFHNGTDYLYYDVPLHVWFDFKGYSSPGLFYNDNIKGQYKSEKL